jgi:hypothetical protein
MGNLSLREKLLALLLAEPEKIPAEKSETAELLKLAEVSVEIPAAPVEDLPPNVCPKCGSMRLHAPSADIVRCQNCAWQKPVIQARGFSRADLFEGRLDSRKMRQSRQQQLNPPGFASAIGRMFGR